MIAYLSLKVIAEVANGQATAIVLRSHNLAIGSGRTNSQIVASLGGIEVYLLGKYVG
jgi:hypothetical protein